jgi:hypothetical protein
MSRLIRYGMLAWPFREFVIYQVKAPLQKAIENESSRLIEKTGAVCKDNPQYEHSESLIELKNWFMRMEDNEGRAPMFEAAFNLIIAKLEGVGNLNYFADKAAIVASQLLKMKVGEPTKINTIHPHTHLLLDLRDWELSENESEQAFFHAAWNILIYEVEHDPYYGFRFNRLLGMIVDKVNSGEWVFGEYHTEYGIRFNRILRRLVDMVNSGEWKFEPWKPADDFCWKERKLEVNT